MYGCGKDEFKITQLYVPDVNSKQVKYTDDMVTITEEVEVSESGSKLDEDGTPSDCLEIGVTSINLKTNAVNTGKIFTKAKAPDVKK